MVKSCWYCGSCTRSSLSLDICLLPSPLPPSFFPFLSFFLFPYFFFLASYFLLSSVFISCFLFSILPFPSFLLPPFLFLASFFFLSPSLLLPSFFPLVFLYILFRSFHCIFVLIRAWLLFGSTVIPVFFVLHKASRCQIFKLLWVLSAPFPLNLVLLLFSLPFLSLSLPSFTNAPHRSLLLPFLLSYQLFLSFLNNA